MFDAGVENGLTYYSMELIRGVETPELRAQARAHAAAPGRARRQGDRVGAGLRAQRSGPTTAT
jgi:hypothetical protein